MIRIDLHVHTFFSGDSHIAPRMLVEQLYKHSIIRGIAVTDHDTVEGYRQVKKLARVYEDVIIIPGIEVSTVEGHINILGVEEKPSYPLTVGEAIDFAKERDGLTIVPHPYRIDGLGDSVRNLNVNAIEVLNRRSSPRENKMAEQLAKELGLPGVAGTDAHRVDQLWKAYTVVNAEATAESVLKAIRKGLVEVRRC